MTTAILNFDSFFNKQVLDNENFGIDVVRALNDDEFNTLIQKFALQTCRIDVKSYQMGRFPLCDQDEAMFTKSMNKLFQSLSDKVAELHSADNSPDLKFSMNVSRNYTNEVSLYTSKKIVFSREQLNQRACQKLAAMKNKILRKKNAKAKITKVEKEIPKTVVIEGIEYNLVAKKK